MRGTVVILLCVLTVACAGRPQPGPAGCEIAARYIEAGNASNAMLVSGLLADDVSAVFLADDGEEHSVLQGKSAVVDAVENYTTQCTNCRSSMRCLHASSDAVYVIEDVTFVDQDGVERQQSAPLIIELDDGLIEDIIYYPASR